MSDNKDIAKIGEFGLIKLLTQNISIKNKTTMVGVGDDSAVLSYGEKKIVVTTDMLTEGVHFNLIYTPLKHLGYKAVIVNLSDVYAMNAIPEQIVVSIAVSSKFSTEMIEELYEGIHLACEYYQVDLVGGDTTSSLTGLTISITAIGSAVEKKIAYRSGAKNTNLVCVTGDLGSAFMGLQLLERENEVFKSKSNLQPDFTGHEYILERQLKPEARKEIIEKFAELDIVPTSMIDISDGLSSEILHLCEMSDCGARIYLNKIPIDKGTHALAEELNLEPITCALNGGEDYELLFTISQTDYEKLKGLQDISVIGYITDKSEGTYLVAQDDSLIEIQSMGWNSLKAED